MTQPLHAPSPEAVIAAASGAGGIPIEDITSSRVRSASRWRDVVLLYLHLSGYTYDKAGAPFGLSVAAVCKAMQRSSGEEWQALFAKLKKQMEKSPRTKN